MLLQLPKKILILPDLVSKRLTSIQVYQHISELATTIGESFGSRSLLVFGPDAIMAKGRHAAFQAVTKPCRWNGKDKWAILFLA